MKTKTSILLAFGLLSLTATGLYAQIGINNTAANPDPSAVLDLQTGNSGVNKGFLPNAVSLTDVTIALPVASPATGLIVYSNTAPSGGNGMGYYYWNGSMWASLNNTDDSLSGSGTGNYVAKWTPNGTTLGVAVIQDDGSEASIDTLPQAGIPLFVNSNNISIEGYSNSNSGAGLYGVNNNWIGVFGVGPYGVVGSSANSSGYGLDGLNSAIGGIGVYGNADTAMVAYGNYDGIHAYGANTGIYAFSTSAGGGGVWGQDDNNVGVFGTSAAGTGVYGIGDNNIGVEGSSANAIGVYGTSTNNFGLYGFSSTYVGLYAEADNGDNAAEIFFNPLTATTGSAVNAVNTLTGNNVLVNYYDGSTAWKITGGGSVGTVVTNTTGNQVRLACPESPEIYFEDYGEGQLVNGTAHIDLDATIAQNVTINEKHPLRVFIQLYDNENCAGVVVKNRTASGFDVVELNHGTSNTAFSWHIVCNRADEQLASGKVSHNADVRYAKVISQDNSVKAIQIKKAAVGRSGNSIKTVAKRASKQITVTPVAPAQLKSKN